MCTNEIDLYDALLADVDMYIYYFTGAYWMFDL